MSSLEKSHSKISNLKLTILCLCTAISTSALWISLMLLAEEKIAQQIAIILISIEGIISLLCLVLFNLFKR